MTNERAWFDAVGGSRERVFAVHGEPEHSDALDGEAPAARHDGAVDVAE